MAFRAIRRLAAIIAVLLVYTVIKVPETGFWSKVNYLVQNIDKSRFLPTWSVKG